MENDELLWQRLIIKVIESDSNKKIFHPSDGQIAGFIKETFTLKEQRKITFEDFKNACTQFKEKLTTEPEQKEKPLYNSQFFRTPVAVTVAESESDHDYHTRI
ncbi:hypothetical protein [Coxiella burnetii]|uniref:hypothetical protein n=2 Tax=Coxiella burnetii TaxID=777 RepID=UPI001E418936|nr:hypothetical protein [Coxiella burnetii]